MVHDMNCILRILWNIIYIKSQEETLTSLYIIEQGVQNDHQKVMCKFPDFSLIFIFAKKIPDFSLFSLIGGHPGCSIRIETLGNFEGKSRLPRQN